MLKNKENCTNRSNYEFVQDINGNWNEVVYPDLRVEKTELQVKLDRELLLKNFENKRVS